MPLRIRSGFLVLALVASGGVLAQTNIRTETIKPPIVISPLGPPGERNPVQGKSTGRFTPSSVMPQIVTDLSRLPAPVVRTRERMLAAARSGDLAKLVALMNETMPIFSFGDDKDPIAFWKANYPDSGGIEVLSILITVLETGYVHVDEGTPQDMYVWPYFVRMSLKTLTPEQRVELFRIITGADYKDMLAFGVYAFYRVGIAPDGTWHFFVTGD
jgi:hypothetical protein